MEGTTYSLVAKSPLKTTNSMRILLPAKPVTVEVTDSAGQPVGNVNFSWDASSHTEWLGFPNSPDGVRVMLKWK